MEWISSGFSVAGDYKSSIFRTKDRRYLLWIYPINRKKTDLERARFEWLPAVDLNNWLLTHGQRPA